MEMKRLFQRRNKLQRNESRIPLIEIKSNNVQKGNDQASNRYFKLLTQNTVNTHEEQNLKSEEEATPQELAELLGVASDANTSVEDIIQRYVLQYFPKVPADLNQNQHLLGVQETVHNDLVKLGPLMKSMGLMGCLVDCYHRQTLDHLDDLLQKFDSFQDSFVLYKWVLHKNPSQELLGHTELQEMGPIDEVDFQLFKMDSERIEKAKDKLLENVQKYIRGILVKTERSQEDGCDGDEAYIQLYMDIIQCIDAVIKEAQQISNLSDDVQEVCFQELLVFLKKYTTEQKEILGNTAKMDKPETILFFKTLNTCKELKQHIQTKGKGIKGSILQETVATLEEMEAFTLKLLLDFVADFTERSLTNYFKTQTKQFFLIDTIETHFTKLPWCQDVQKSVMDEAYKLIVHFYIKHLIQSSQSKLKKCWSPNVGERVTEDAELLHDTISELAPGVKQWNLLLLKFTELLECKSTDSAKLVAASMQKECLSCSEDLECLPTLLRWTGLSRRGVREVLDAIPGHQPRPRPWYSCLTCW